jgi:hypothetical protein
MEQSAYRNERQRVVRFQPPWATLPTVAEGGDSLANAERRERRRWPKSSGRTPRTALRRGNSAELSSTQVAIMLNCRCILAVAAGLLMFLASSVYGDGREVVIRGGMESNSMCVPDSKADKIWVVFAVDGSPEIAARVKKVFDECYPDKGLDADAAVKLQNAYDAELKFFVAPDSPATLPALKSYDESSQPVAVTGTLYDKDCRHSIKVTKLEHIQLKYPEKMLAPDVPFVMPERQPLVLTIAPNLVLKCIKIPAGKAVLGAQFYMGRRYQEEFPRLVTLTKPYYMSEIPITQEIWEAIMGDNPSKQKGARLPVQNPPFPDVDAFCRILSRKTGRKVRLPRRRNGNTRPALAHLIPVSPRSIAIRTADYLTTNLFCP